MAPSWHYFDLAQERDARFVDRVVSPQERSGIDITLGAVTQQMMSEEIVVTLCSSKEFRQQRKTLGLSTVLVKPEFKEEALPATVKEVLGA